MKKLSLLLFLLFGLALLAGACTGEKAAEVSQDQALTIAQDRFAEYLQEHPELEVEDPVYTVTEKEDVEGRPYWSVQVKLQEEAYSTYYYEVMISPDGKKVTLATG